MMNIGEKISELRSKNGLSQGALAEFLNVSRQSVSKWETGQSIPDIDKIIKLSEYFNVSVDYLVKENFNEETVKPDNDINMKNENELKGTSTKTLGYILIATGLLLVGSSFIFTIFAAVLGIILFILGIEFVLVKKNLPLVIAWTILIISICIMNPYTTSIPSTIGIIYSFKNGVSLFSARILIGITQRICGIILVFKTFKKIMRKR